MRTVLFATLLMMVAFSGCADETKPETAAKENEEPNTGPETPETPGPTEPGTPPSEPSEPGTNAAPEATLQANLTAAVAPASILFFINGTDAEGDAMSWTLDANGDNETDAQGDSVPAEASFVFEEPGSYTARLTISDGQSTTAAEITVEVSAPEAAPAPEPLDYTGTWNAVGSFCETGVAGSTYDGVIQGAANVGPETWGGTFEAMIDFEYPELGGTISFSSSGGPGSMESMEVSVGELVTGIIPNDTTRVVFQVCSAGPASFDLTVYPLA